MSVHRMTTPTGDEFELELDKARRITQVTGPWPTEHGAEFELRGGLPPHSGVDGAPAHIQAAAAAKGRHVCMYDPDACQTCFCDDAGDVLYCQKMC